MWWASLTVDSNQRAKVRPNHWMGDVLCLVTACGDAYWLGGEVGLFGESGEMDASEITKHPVQYHRPPSTWTKRPPTTECHRTSCGN